jgi:hypothetical protein
MADHWWQRPGRAPGRLLYHWHELFHDQPEVQRLASTAQRKLEALPGLDMVPIQWLHLTTRVVGFADEVSTEQVAAMTADARQRLARMAGIPVSPGRIFYHPEAVVPAVEPLDALTPVREAVRAATERAGPSAPRDHDHDQVRQSGGADSGRAQLAMATGGGDRSDIRSRRLDTDYAPSPDPDGVVIQITYRTRLGAVGS